MSSEANFLRVVQISDCHLPADPRTPYRGQDADANLKGVWEKVVSWSPDLILLVFQKVQPSSSRGSVW